jgi:cytosine/adenosine deaminase-related metal-dependent hydrolase
MADCGLGSPLAQVARCGLLGEDFLAVHANYLLPADVDALAASGASVVHCPRSHAYFQHRRFPFAELAAAGVNICLGTDSLASVIHSPRHKPELNLFLEMRSFAAAHPGVAPETIVQMATSNGARALGRQGRAGELSPGARADLIAIPCHGAADGSAAEVVRHSGPVAMSIIDGRCVAGSLER